MAARFKVSIAGIPLLISPISNDIPNSIVQHKIPFKAGGIVQNMGADSETIRFTAYFSESEYDAHRDVKDLMLSTDEIELIHPEYGKVSGYIKSQSIRKENINDSVETDITFIVKTPVAVAITTVPQSIGISTGKSFEELLRELITDMINNMSAEWLLAGILPPDIAELMETTIDFADDVGETFDTVSGFARDAVNVINAYVTGFQGVLANITQPINSIISAIDYVTTLPGLIIKSIADVADRFIDGYNTIVNAPDRFIDSFINGMSDMKNSMPHPKGVSIVSLINTSYNAETVAIRLATAPGVVPEQIGLSPVQIVTISVMQNTIDAVIAAAGMMRLGQLFEDDEVSRRAQISRENTKTFDIAGNRVPKIEGISSISAPEDAPIVTVKSIETAMNSARTVTQAAIDNNRMLQGLKDMARDLAVHVSNVKLKLETIETIYMDASMPMHLLMLSRGLSYNAAERTQAINNIREPNFMEGSIKVYVS